MSSPLSPGVYRDAERSHFTSTGHPGLAMTGNGHACNTLTGQFQIHELVLGSAGLSSITVSFEQHCEGDTMTMLEGCLRYQEAP